MEYVSELFDPKMLLFQRATLRSIRSGYRALFCLEARSISPWLYFSHIPFSEDMFFYPTLPPPALTVPDHGCGNGGEGGQGSLCSADCDMPLASHWSKWNLWCLNNGNLAFTDAQATCVEICRTVLNLSVKRAPLKCEETFTRLNLSPNSSHFVRL